jgi:glucose-1-phosphate adenylyltransferase
VLTQKSRRRPVHAFASARLDDALVSSGARVRGEVVRSVLGPGASVAAGAVVRDAIVLAGASVAAGAVVEGAVVDERAHVGAGARVGGPVPSGPVPGDRLALVGRRARIADGARVAPGARVRPGETVSS